MFHVSLHTNLILPQRAWYSLHQLSGHHPLQHLLAHQGHYEMVAYPDPHLPLQNFHIFHVIALILQQQVPSLDVP